MCERFAYPARGTYMGLTGHLLDSRGEGREAHGIQSVWFLFHHILVKLDDVFDYFTGQIKIETLEQKIFHEFSDRILF